MLPLRDNLPTDRFPVVTVALIAICVLVFAWQLTLDGEPAPNTNVTESDEASVEFGAIPYRLTNPGSDCGVTASGEVACEGTEAFAAAEGSGSLVALADAPWWVTIFTSMFMHGSFLHIAGNMLFLWVFGNNVEDSMGRPKFLAFYLLSGIAAIYAQTLLEPDSTVPTIGASGAVAGVLGGYILLHPRARILTLVFLVFLITFIEVPAMLMLGAWFVLQLLPAVGQVATDELAGEGGGVAYLAHVGGFLFGLATIKLWATRKRGDPGEDGLRPAR